MTFRRQTGEALRDAVARTIREAIRDGVLRPGARLPASRMLAQELGVSRGVISEAYAQLEAQGCVITRERTAPEVASIPASSPTGHASATASAARAPRFDFTPTTPDVTLFPVREWVRAYGQAARRSPTSVLDYRQTEGEPALRHALADHLGRTRGAVVDPDRLMVVQGTAQAVDLLLRVCQQQGRTRVAVENPSHTTQHERIRAAGFDLVPLAVDAEGALPPSGDADVALVTPAHQFPTGVVLSGERRRRLIEWASEVGAWLVEDDYDSEFRYDKEGARALQGVAPNQVVLVGTVSKTLAPALRLGWIVAPVELVEPLAAAKRLADDFTPSLDQLALAELLTRGDYDRHVRRTRAAYRRRRDALLAALEEYLPQLVVEGVAAGVHLLVRLDADVDDAAVAAAAGAERIYVEPLSRYYLGKPLARGLVLGYGRMHESAIRPAVRALARAIER